MTRLEEVKKIMGKGRNKKSYADVARIMGLSRQRVHALATGYEKRYRHSESYRMYRRHTMQHLLGTKLRKPCKYCGQETADSSMVFTKPSV